jgi:hypothetical protein
MVPPGRNPQASNDNPVAPRRMLQYDKRIIVGE